MTREDFNNFAKRSGLKVKFIAEQCGVPAYVMSHWTGSYGRLTHKQMERLERFCADYEKTMHLCTIQHTRNEVIYDKN